MTQFLYETLAKRLVFWIGVAVGCVAAMAFIALFLFRQEYVAATDAQLSNLIETRREFSDFRTALGYGGFIHTFKNYVLRGTPDYLAQANDQMHKVRTLWTSMEKRLPGFFDEKAAITTMLRDYSESLGTANREVRQNAEALDALVKVDDAPALQGMKLLSDYIASEIHRVNYGRRHTEMILGLCLELAGFLTFLSLFIAYLNRSIRLERAEVAEREQEIRQRIKELTIRKSMLELQQGQAEQLGGFGTWILNLDSWTLQWSDGVFLLHGRPVTAGVPHGKDAGRYYSATTQKEMTHLIRRAARDRSHFNFRFSLTREDGQTRQAIASGHFAEHMGHRYLVGMFRDITGEHALEPAAQLT